MDNGGFKRNALLDMQQVNFGKTGDFPCPGQIIDIAIHMHGTGGGGVCMHS